MSLNLGLEGLIDKSAESLDSQFKAHYEQSVSYKVLGKDVELHINMYDDTPVFSKNVLDGYSKIISVLDKQVEYVMKQAVARLAESNVTTSEADMKAGLHYVSIHISTAKNGKLFYEIGFSYKGNMHLFSIEFVDGKQINPVSMNG